MKPVLIDLSEFCEKLSEVKSDKPIDEGRIVRDGLFSHQIFGPSKSWRCSCPKSEYHGPQKQIKKCPVCNVDIVSSEERRKRYAKIVLPFPVLNPIFYFLLILGKPFQKRVIDDILFYRKKYYISKEKTLHVYDVNINKDDILETLEGLEGIKKYISYFYNDLTKDDQKFIEKNKHLLELKNVLVIPPVFRSYSKDSSGKILSDKLNQFYREILMRSKKIHTLHGNLNEMEGVFKYYFKIFQTQVNNIYEYVFSRLSKKTGIIRKNILGKRVDFSGRAVISPDPNLNLDESGIPYLLLLEILKPQLTAYLVKKRITKRYNNAVQIIEKCIQTEDIVLFDIVKEYCKDKICILNRQPTLHRMGILSFKIKPTFGKTIQIHPMVCTPFNGDFDGDQMAIYIPITEIAVKDTNEKIGIWNNLISPTDISIVPRPNQDIILGIFDQTK